MLQTSSNQPFIFSSPRLREQIGASSEIVLLSRWVKGAAFDMKFPSMSTVEEGIKTLPTSFWVLDSSGEVTVRFTESGGSLEKLVRQLVRGVALRAPTDAPGLDITGVIVQTSSNTIDAGDLNAFDSVFLEYLLNRHPALARFPQFSLPDRADESAPPASAALPEEELDGIREYMGGSLVVPVLSDDHGQVPTQAGKDRDRSLSLPLRVKRIWSRSIRRLQLGEVTVHQDSGLSDEEVRDRIGSLNGGPFQPKGTFQDVSDGNGAVKPLPELSSVGVVHIDGNGMGTIMRDPGRVSDIVDARLDSFRDAAYQRRDNPYLIKHDRFQQFVAEVDYRLGGVVNQAVAGAWQTVDNIAGVNCLKTLPVVPVLVDGDGVTAYMDGRYATPSAEAYIRHCKCLTGEDNLPRKLAIITHAPSPGSLTASAGMAVIGHNFPPHIAYDLAESLVSRGEKLSKKPEVSPYSMIGSHVLRDTTVLAPQDTLEEHKGRTQRPLLTGHYTPEWIGGATTASASGEAPQAQDQRKKILQTTAALDGKDPDSPGKMVGDPFPRARADHIIKLLTEGKEEQATTEWSDALQNTPGAGLLARQLELLPPHSSSSDEAGESLKRIR